MSAANLALRIILELVALCGFGVLAWNFTNGWWRIGAVIMALVAMMTLWEVFAVPDDPIRSGNAPVPVPGLVRLALEFAILLGGGMALFFSGHSLSGITLIAFVLLHYSLSVERLIWLLQQ